MGKQYTFKTTRDTQWLEPLLDALQSNERSKTMREALTLYFDDQRPAVTRGQTKVTPKETPRVPLEVPKVTPREHTIPLGNGYYEVPNKATPYTPFPEPTIESTEVDLESTLDNLDF